jgi:hypothetical protein
MNLHANQKGVEVLPVLKAQPRNKPNEPSNNAKTNKRSYRKPWSQDSEMQHTNTTPDAHYAEVWKHAMQTTRIYWANILVGPEQDKKHDVHTQHWDPTLQVLDPSSYTIEQPRTAILGLWNMQGGSRWHITIDASWWMHVNDSLPSIYLMFAMTRHDSYTNIPLESLWLILTQPYYLQGLMTWDDSFTVWLIP